MISYIKATLVADPSEVTHGLKSTSATQIAVHYTDAMNLPSVAWDLALMSRDEADTGRGQRAIHSVLSSLGVRSDNRVVLRAQALEICRLWWTELLHHDCKYKPIGIHILKAPSNHWRL